jgi:hypothetical protein
MSSTICTTVGRDRVGRFQSLDGAARAVNHLVELRYDPADVAIVPKDFEVVEADRLRDRVRRGVGLGAVIGTVVMGGISVVATIGVEQLVRSTLPYIALSATAGACIGIVVGVIRHRLLSAFAIVDVPRELRSTTFDVVVDRESDAARHDLESWWDPAAPPAQRRHAA